MISAVKEFPVTIYDGHRPLRVTDAVIEEVPLAVYLDGRHVVTIACAGIYLEDLALGYLKSEGMIGSLKDVRDITVSEEGPSVHVDTGKATGERIGTGPQVETILSSGARKRKADLIGKPLESSLTLPAEQVFLIMEQLLGASELHARTHGAHCSAIADMNGIILYRDDIGRHNTYDMLNGYLLRTGGDRSGMLIATTGRVSTEILFKVYGMGIPVIVSHAVPTSRAIKLAMRAGITLIGYVRKGTMKIYTHEERLTWN
ncbi:MAG: formate dehydrogenase accessory sulfurtransferase FdhD [Deltaproteobacteria bacterium]|nr:formate dehydrogenase accessory sulfurtransferase FdhD [Deltaproteobacteria bacterium]